MLIPGLVSVTFRQLSPREIVDLVARARLRSIEWGGDIHVPPTGVSTAREVRTLTTDAGLLIPSYASYYRLAHTDPSKNPRFEEVLDTAVALGAPVIRVWAGTLASADATSDYRAAAANDARRICTLAEQAGIRVSLEYHTRTLTDTNESAQALLREVDHPNLSLHWQPTPSMDRPTRLAGLRLALPRLTHLHVYHYTGAAYAPLDEIADEWRDYLSLARTTGRDHHCLLEFVRNDSPDAFIDDAATLLNLLSSG